MLVIWKEEKIKDRVTPARILFWKILEITLSHVLPFKRKLFLISIRLFHCNNNPKSSAYAISWIFVKKAKQIGFRKKSIHERERIRFLSQGKNSIMEIKTFKTS